MFCAPLAFTKELTNFTKVVHQVPTLFILSSRSGDLRPHQMTVSKNLSPFWSLAPLPLHLRQQCKQLSSQTSE